MVKGLEVFGKYFAGFEDQYVIIGGAACDFHVQEARLTPRATKDIDIILIVEALRAGFVRHFWDFIAEGKYARNEIGGQKRKHYRFLKPENSEYPVQIELFCRNPDLQHIDQRIHLIPIPVLDDLSSLSAILLDDHYYQLVIEHSTVLNGIHWANIESLICLKAKAYIDILRRIGAGSKETQKQLRKHKSDVFRLGILLAESDVHMLPDLVLEDLRIFLEYIKDDLPDQSIFREMGIPGISSKNVFHQIKRSLMP